MIVFKTPPITTSAVIVKFAAEVVAVGVPEIVPDIASNIRPAGKVPVIEYVIEDPDSACTEVVIGVIAVPTEPVNVATEVVITGLVTNVVAVVALPEPAEFVAVTTAL